MARRAPDVATAEPASPPKRATRARTRNTTMATTNSRRAAKADASAAKTASAVKTTGAKRGRPKKTEPTTGTTSAAAAKTRNTSSTVRRTKGSDKVAGLTAARTKNVEDHEEELSSSDDEMDVVTVRNTSVSSIGSRSTMTSDLSGSTGPMTGRGRRVPATAARFSATTASSRKKEQTGNRVTDAGKIAGDVDDGDDDDDDELALLEVSTGSARGTNGVRISKTAVATRSQRTRQASAASESSVKAAPRRSKKTVAESEPAMTVPQRASKSTSATAKRATGPTSSSASRSKAAAVAPKKKVTFLEMTEDSDKENVVVVPALNSRETKDKVATGMTAKPVRPAATRGQNHVSSSNEAAAPAPAKEPLSPKKATQVAKSGSGSLDDAADSDVPSQPNSPVKQPGKSPTKVASLSSAFASPPRKIDSGASITAQIPPLSGPKYVPEEPVEPTSPRKALVPLKESLIASSPARRPPPSPHKDIMMKELPRKAPIVFEPEASSPAKTSRNVTSSPLKESPRKVKLTASLTRWSVSGGSTLGSPVKDRSASMLFTPAKRAPMLATTPLSIRTKTPNSIARMYNHSGMGCPEKREQLVEPQTPLEEPPQDAEMILNPETTHIPEHNVLLDGPSEESTLEIPPPEGWQPDQDQESISPEVDEFETRPCRDLQDLQLNAEDEQFVVSQINSVTSTPAGKCTVLSAESSVDSVRGFRDIPPPAPSSLVLNGTKPSDLEFRDKMDDSDSESMMDMSPMKKSYERPESPSPAGDDLGFTPLAAKLNQWRASSPDKRPTRKYHIPGPFSPVKLQSRRPRDSLDAKHSQRMRDSMVSRASLAPATPTLARLFEVETTVPLKQNECLDDASMVTENESRDGVAETDVTMSIQPRDDCEALASETQQVDDVEDEEDIYGDENVVPDEQTIIVSHQPLPEDSGNENGTDAVDKEVHAEQSVLPDEPTVTLPPSFFSEDKEQSPALQRPLSPRIPLLMSVTPVRGRAMPQTVHTVSKVPLKPEGDTSLIVSRKRPRSLSSDRNREMPQLEPTSAVRIKTLPSPTKSIRTPLKPFEPEYGAEPPLVTENTPRPTPTPQSAAHPSPPKSAKKTVTSQVLQGAVVYTDVHTSEGADASGIFIELLTQMGARCVKSWNWNPRASLSPVDGSEPRETKIGITHVVFKDGGVRTLEKVREANGVVKCVGVGWVLDCERANRWLDEADYAVDLSMIPRGGQKRRKSMEPRALSNVNGSLVKLDSSTCSMNAWRTTEAEQEACMQELRRLSPTPKSVSRRTTMEFSREEESGLVTPRPQPRSKSKTYHRRGPRPSFGPGMVSSDSSPRREGGIQPPSTPSFDYDTDYTFSFNYDDEEDNTISAPSPTTPFYLSERSKLVQQTCPPKQLRQGLFDSGPGNSSGVGGEEFTMSEGLRKRLEAARRKSLVWRPKVGSPLARQ
ncbi:hypothetical protein VTO42DRAFT_1263 [Malbranchea cinnamomea]